MVEVVVRLRELCAGRVDSQLLDVVLDTNHDCVCVLKSSIRLTLFYRLILSTDRGESWCCVRSLWFGVASRFHRARLQGDALAPCRGKLPLGISALDAQRPEAPTIHYQNTGHDIAWHETHKMMFQRAIFNPSLRLPIRRYSNQSVKPPIISIKNATFYRHHPASHPSSPNPALFPDLSFELQSFPQEEEQWAILGPSSSGKTTFLEILQSKFLSFPPRSRSYPYLSSNEIDHKNHELRIPSRAIQYVGFGGERDTSNGTRGAYLSARYESLKEATDWTVMNYLEGKTELNPFEEDLAKQVDSAALQKVIKDLRLEELVDMPVANLSNGQTRRAKIAKAILERPEVLLLDEVCSSICPYLSTTQILLVQLTMNLKSRGTHCCRFYVLTPEAIHGLRSTYTHESLATPPRPCASKFATFGPFSSSSRSDSRLDHPSNVPEWELPSCTQRSKRRGSQSHSQESS